MEEVKANGNVKDRSYPYYAFYGKNPGSLAGKIQSSVQEDVQAMYDVYEAKLLSVLDQYAEVKPNVLEAVAKLRENGIKIGSTTGYTDKMMEIVTRVAKENGYEPDAWFSPDAVGSKGRPYPYMVFENMKALGIDSVKKVVKVGDTISDILEGKNAGVISIGVIEGSSEMGLSQEEYEALSEEEKKAAVESVKEKFFAAGADDVIQDMGELVDLILK